ncbi:MAG: M23 family metallopeptidase [Mariprofundaceae bacterium]|nr:M23 family metallopeptidase [Mariprofundaceae bacterium]
MKLSSRYRCMNLRFLLFGLAIFLFSGTASAQIWEAVQGDVLSIDLPVSGEPLDIRAFGKSWPWKRLDGAHIRTWIGIDLAAKPGRHNIEIHSGKNRQMDFITVKKGSFRISRIEVQKKMAVFDAKSLKRIRADQAAIRATYSMPLAENPDISISFQPVKGIVSTPFGAQRYVNGEPRSPHSGLDIAAPEGTPIVTPLGGRVLLAEAMYLNGNTVVIGHGNGLVMVYSHMKKLAVHKGEWLKSGASIGEIGQTGRATGPHLHWGIRFNNARINPLSLLKANR